MTLLEERTNTLQKEVTYIAHKSRQNNIKKSYKRPFACKIFYFK